MARISLKAGVSLSNLQPQAALGLQIAAGCYGMVGMEEMVVTSVNDSKHRSGSLHYAGAAFDLRSKTVRTNDIEKLVSYLKMSLGADFDVVIEDFQTNTRQANEHIHIEFQPKG
jgi:hypothetical protein